MPTQWSMAWKRRAPDPEALAMSPADDARLGDLIRQGLGLTAAAALMRKPYAALAAAMDRLGLSRSSGGAGPSANAGVAA